MPGSYLLPYLTTLSWPRHLENYPPSILEILRVKHQPVTSWVKLPVTFGSCTRYRTRTAINLEFHITPSNFVQIPGTVSVATVFLYRLAHLYIVLIRRHFPNYSLLPPTFTPQCLPPRNFSCLYCYDVVITFELE